MSLNRRAAHTRTFKLIQSRFTTQRTAAPAAGYSTGGTVGTAFGAHLLIKGEDVHSTLLAPFVLFVAAPGVFPAILMNRQMINVGQLPFPSGVAAPETLRSLSRRVERLRVDPALRQVVGGRAKENKAVSACELGQLPAARSNRSW